MSKDKKLILKTIRKIISGIKSSAGKVNAITTMCVAILIGVILQPSLGIVFLQLIQTLVFLHKGIEFPIVLGTSDNLIITLIELLIRESIISLIMVVINNHFPIITIKVKEPQEPPMIKK